jgi:hypothetical protein
LKVTLGTITEFVPAKLAYRGSRLRFASLNDNCYHFHADFAHGALFRLKIPKTMFLIRQDMGTSILGTQMPHYLAIVMPKSGGPVSLDPRFRIGDLMGKKRLQKAFLHTMCTPNEKRLTAIPLTP